MPLMQAAYDKLPDCNVMFSSVDDFPYSIFGSDTDSGR